LLALPALLTLGVLEAGEQTYGTLKKVFYGLRATLLVLAFMALLRIRTPEQLQGHPPGELGVLLGLDRAPWADGDGRDRRDLIALVAMPDDRGLPPRRPRSPNVGDQQEAALVGERQVRLQARCVFFTAVQRYRFQRSIAASSRSTARRSGFWHDQFSALSTRLICARCRLPSTGSSAGARRWRRCFGRSSASRRIMYRF